MHTLRRHRLLQRQVVVVQVVEHLEDRGEDPRATRRTQHQRDLAIAGHQARGHRRQHALARLDGIGIATDHTEGVRHTRLGTEVVHLVIEQEARALHHHAAAVVPVQGVGVADRVALLVDDGEVRGLVRLQPRAHLGGVGDGGRVDLLRALGQVVLGDQLRHRHLGKRRVAQVVGTVGEHTLLDFRKQVDVACRVQLDTLEVGCAVFLDAQQLRQRDAARAGQRRGVDHVATPFDAHRLTPHGLVVLEVFLADQALVGLHLRHQQVGGLALVELAHTLVGNALQGLRQLGLPEGLAHLHAAEIVVEVGAVLEQPLGIFAVLVLLGGDLEAVLRVAHRRGQQLGPGQLAELLVRLPQAHHRARHPGGPGAHQAEVLDDLAFVVQVHVAAGRLGRHFTVVEEVGFAIHVQGHETAAADVAGLGVGNGQGEGSGHRGVHCVAALLEDVGGDLCTILIGRGHRAAVQRHGIG